MNNLFSVSSTCFYGDGVETIKSFSSVPKPMNKRKKVKDVFKYNGNKPKKKKIKEELQISYPFDVEWTAHGYFDAATGKVTRVEDIDTDSILSASSTGLYEDGVESIKSFLPIPEPNETMKKLKNVFKHNAKKKTTKEELEISYPFDVEWTAHGYFDAATGKVTGLEDIDSDSTLSASSTGLYEDGVEPIKSFLPVPETNETMKKLKNVFKHNAKKEKIEKKLEISYPYAVEWTAHGGFDAVTGEFIGFKDIDRDSILSASSTSLYEDGVEPIKSSSPVPEPMENMKKLKKIFKHNAKKKTTKEELADSPKKEKTYEELEISYPFDFERTVHVGYDAATRKFTGVPSQWLNFFQLFSATESVQITNMLSKAKEIGKKRKAQLKKRIEKLKVSPDPDGCGDSNEVVSVEEMEQTIYNEENFDDYARPIWNDADLTHVEPDAALRSTQQQSSIDGQPLQTAMARIGELEREVEELNSALIVAVRSHNQVPSGQQLTNNSLDASICIRFARRLQQVNSIVRFEDLRELLEARRRNEELTAQLGIVGDRRTILDLEAEIETRDQLIESLLENIEQRRRLHAFHGS